jgi:hypothetical protein
LIGRALRDQRVKIPFFSAYCLKSKAEDIHPQILQIDADKKKYSFDLCRSALSADKTLNTLFFIL